MTFVDQPEIVLADKGVIVASTEGVVAARSLRSRALRASTWVIASKPLGMVLQTARNLILTRLLFPEAFGLMALVNVVLRGLQMCSDAGVGPSIVQSARGTEERFLQTAWTVQIIRGVILWLLCCVLAWPAAAFYHQPMLMTLLPVAGFSVAIGGFHTSAWAVYGREMKQGWITIVDLTVQLINLIVMVVVAWWLRSVWALVIGSLSGSVLSVVLGYWWMPGIRHRLCWDAGAVRELVHFGKWIFISTLLTFFAMQLDSLLLAKLIPMALLGVYSISLTVANAPKDLAQQIASVVLFPSLAEKFRQNPENMQGTLTRSRGALLRIGLLLCLGVLAAAPAFFHYLYDPRYAAAGWIAQLLAFSCWVTVLNASTGFALLVFGDSKAVALGNLLNVVVTCTAAIGGFYVFGLPGFIIGYALGTAAGEIVQVFCIRRHGISVVRQDVLFTGSAFGVGIVYCGIVWWLHLNEGQWGPLLESAVATVLWLAMAAWLLPSVKRDLVPNLRLSRIGRWRRSASPLST